MIKRNTGTRFFAGRDFAREFYTVNTSILGNVAGFEPCQDAPPPPMCCVIIGNTHEREKVKYE